MVDRKLEDLPHEPSGNPLEHTGQVDPMMREGRASHWRIWAIGIGIVVILAVVIYGISGPTENSVPSAPQNAQLPTSSSNNANPSQPSGRGNANAPQPAPPGSVQTQGQGGSKPQQ